MQLNFIGEMVWGLFLLSSFLNGYRLHNNQKLISSELKNKNIFQINYAANSNHEDSIFIHQNHFFGANRKLSTSLRKLHDRRHFQTSLYFKVSENEALDEVQEEVEFEDAGRGGGDMIRKLTNGLVPLAASVGFAMTPSTLLAARVAGAAAGGVAGFLTRSLILNRELKVNDLSATDNYGNDFIGTPSISKTIATLKKGPLLDLTPDALEKVAQFCEVEEEQLSELYTHLLAEAVYTSTRSESLDLIDLSDTLDFIKELDFSPPEIANGLTIAAVRVGKEFDHDERGFLSKSFDLIQLHQAAKIFFLGDKLIGKLNGHFGSRFKTSLSYFPVETYNQLISTACTQLFRKCIQGVLSNPYDYTKDEIVQLQSFLTTTDVTSNLRPAMMQNMIMKAIEFTIQSTIGKDHDYHALMTASLGDYDKLLKVQEVLGFSKQNLESTIQTQTLPIFENIVKNLINRVFDRPENSEEYSKILEERVQALRIDKRTARSAINNVIRSKNSDFREMIERVYSTTSAGSLESTYKLLVSYSNSFEALKTFAAPVMDNAVIPLPGLPLSRMVKYSLFKMQLSKEGEEETAANSDLFALSATQQQAVRKFATLPKVISWVEACINQNNWNENAKKAYMKLLEDMNISPEDWKSTAIDFYYQEAEKIANSKAVPSSSDMEKLKNLKEFLGCDDEMVAKVNLELLGDKYSKAVLESMTPSGVITDEYIDGLERLRVRLGLSTEDAMTLLGYAARKRMGPIVKDLVDVWKSDTAATVREDKDKATRKDKSGDPISSPDNVFGFMEIGAQKPGGGPNVFMREAMNLVDFYVENYGIQGVNVLEDDDEEGESEVEQSRKKWLVNVVGTVPEEDLSGVFKHFVVTRLAEPDNELRARYINAEPLFAKILGIDTENQIKLKQSLGFSVYTNMLRNWLMYKDSITPQDLQQIVIIKDGLQLDPSIADKIYNQAALRAVLDHGKAMFSQSSSLTPSLAVRYRLQVQSLGFDFKQDIGFNDKFISYLYALEVQYFVENGEEYNLKDVQEAYDIPEERAAQIVEATCKRYINQLLNIALRAAKKYDEIETVKWMREIAKYAIFVSSPVDADGGKFNEKDKDRMLEFYQSRLENDRKKALKDGNTEEVDAIQEKINFVDKLREIIYLNENYLPPDEGIDGLLNSLLGGNTAAPVKDKKSWGWS